MVVCLYLIINQKNHKYKRQPIELTMQCWTIAILICIYNDGGVTILMTVPWEGENNYNRRQTVWYCQWSPQCLHWPELDLIFIIISLVHYLENNTNNGWGWEENTWTCSQLSSVHSMGWVGFNKSMLGICRSWLGYNYNMTIISL